ncbi:hypothetical protein [Ferrimicrobium acidiphilum]|uniref:Uncharacterized protein n=1 Tax=Ferrimicrobium acidiphilum DSM 19497 TaxID=1121877 RepID=A0A0D8FQZ4_9ACTN|nr:hypothetical protein [Ferrimicrobium acidiphilum]KJE75698.1 hypothetical protein FEAC_25400 [Ferrimicrobium acidiphilum DSM 19497]
MTDNSHPRLRELHAQRESALRTWLVVNAALLGAIERLGQLRAAKAEALKARGISAHQLAQFRRWEQGAAKPTEYRTLASYAQHRHIIAPIDRRWDGVITTAQVEVDRATTDLAVATADLLSTMHAALASELTGLSVRRLSTIVRAVANTHSAPTTRTVQRP